MAMDQFIKFTPDIKGEAKDKAHNKEIDVLAWSWGMSNSGSFTSGSGATTTGLSRGSVNFVLQIEDGACTSMAINEKGLPGEKKPNTSTTNNPK